jgi:tripartite-type tricarboxylate transporter receptor subunit TctC
MQSTVVSNAPTKERSKDLIERTPLARVRLTPFALVALLICTWFALPASAQAPYPARPIRMIVPFAAGGAADVTARILANHMTPLLGQSVVVENRGGAGGSIGVEAVSTSPADGYTLLYTGGTALTLTPLLDPAAVRYNVLRDLSPVSRVMVVPLILVTPPGITDFSALKNRLQRDSASATFGSAGTGSSSQVVPLYLAHLLNVKMTEVPYKGNGAALADVLAGRVDVFVDAITTVSEHIKGGRMNGLAVFAKDRLPGFNIPTIAEVGLPQMVSHDWTSWSMVLLPSATPPDVVNRVHSAVYSAAKTPVMAAEFAKLQTGLQPTTLSESKRFLEDQLQTWPKVLSTIGIGPQSGR